MKHLTIVPLAVLAVTPLARATAQEQPPPVEPGQRVSVTAPGASPVALVGRLDSVDADSLRLRRALETSMAISIRDVVRLEVSRGRRRALGAGVGFAAGAVLGATVGAVAYSGTDTPKETVAVGSAAFGGVVSALFGLLIGGMIDRWEEVPLDRLRPSVAAQHDGRLGLAVSIAF
jgi:hypothetical protein